ncbi:MAG: hypothetical protein ACK4NV_15660 [Pannonibacter sp.]
MLRSIPIALSSCLLATATLADGTHALHQSGAVLSSANAAVLADYDILAAHVHRDGATLTFHMTTSGKAGASRPASTGAMAGSRVETYAWPTSLDPSTVGFEQKAGILALVATVHPDFDDTPLFDENNDGELGNDGNVWHSHWVVLVPNEACGKGALAVKDIPAGTRPPLPRTWPGVPVLLDSPGYSPVFDGPEIKVSVPLGTAEAPEAMAYDGVTAALKVNANVHAPLLCITDVFDVASGNLSLPGRLK